MSKMGFIAVIVDELKPSTVLADPNLKFLTGLFVLWALQGTYDKAF